MGDPTESTPSPATHTPPPTSHVTVRRPPTTRTLPPPAADHTALDPVRELLRRPSEMLDQSPSAWMPLVPSTHPLVESSTMLLVDTASTMPSLVSVMTTHRTSGSLGTHGELHGESPVTSG